MEQCCSINFIISFLLISSKCFVQGDNKNEELIREIFQDYNKFIRPVHNFGEATKVTFYLTLLQLISVTEKIEEMTSSVYLTLSWRDLRLSWKPEEFNGISQIRIPSDAIWKPDFALHNNNDGNYDTTVPVNALVNSTGVVEWLPAALYKSSCKIKVDFFPFDWQNCTMKFKSFAYNKNEIDFESAYSKVVVDQQAYRDNGEWNIVHCPIKTNENPSDPLYQDITAYFIIERRPLFYVINILVPCILISSLSVLVFVLPSASSEKMTMGISVLLGLTVYLLLLAKRVPETSLGIPLVGSFLLYTIVSVTISIVFSVLVLNCYHQCFSILPMPKWCHFLFMNFFPRMLGMEQPDSGRRRLLEEYHQQMKEIKSTCFQSNGKNSNFYFNKHGNSGCAEKKFINLRKQKSMPDLYRDFCRSQSSDVFVTSPRKQRTSLENRSNFIRARSQVEGDFTWRRNRLSASWENIPSCCLNRKVRSADSFDVARDTDASTNNCFLSSSSNQSHTLGRSQTHSLFLFNSTCDSRAKTSSSLLANDFSLSCLHSSIPDTFKPSSSSSLPEVTPSAIQFKKFSSISSPNALWKYQENAKADNIFTDYPKRQTSKYQIQVPVNSLAENNRNTSKSLSFNDLKTSRIFKRNSKRTKMHQRNWAEEVFMSTKQQINPRKKHIKKKSKPYKLTSRGNQHQHSKKIAFAYEAVHYISERMRFSDQISVRIEDWHFIANVLDRLLLILFFIVFLLGILVFSLKAMLNFRPENPFKDGDPKYAGCMVS